MCSKSLHYYNEGNKSYVNSADIAWQPALPQLHLLAKGEKRGEDVGRWLCKYLCMYSSMSDITHRHNRYNSITHRWQTEQWWV